MDKAQQTSLRLRVKGALENNVALKKAKASAERLAKRAQEEPNKIQLGIASVGTMIGVPAGYKLQAYLDDVTSDWIDPETQERSTAGWAVTNVVPVALGGGIALAGAAMSKNGPGVSFAIGTGVGIAVGSITRSVLGAPET